MKRNLNSAVARSRRLFGNPYAHIEAFELDDLVSHHGPTYRHSDEELRAKVKQLHRRLWDGRHVIWQGKPPTDPVLMLDPVVALRTLGYDVQLEIDFAARAIGREAHQIAGVINQDLMLVRVSERMEIPVRNFTSAHELGHAVLHPAFIRLHRDRPVDAGDANRREPTEVEADKFATYFLMPATLVTQRFKAIFHRDFITVDDHTAWMLFGRPISAIGRNVSSLRDLSRAAAALNGLQGRCFRSLAEQFSVSIEAMAIRLEEIMLVR